MAQHKSRAFILSAAEYRETSKLLHLFCENEGRISLIAKGLRSPKSKNPNAAEPFSLAEVTYRLKEGESLGLLTAVETERTFPGARTKLESYALASYWFEVVQTAAQARLAAPEFFNLTASFLESLEGAETVTELTAWHFGRLLQALGFGAEMDACGVCGGKELLHHFDPEQGTAVCSRCARPRRPYLPLSVSTQADLERFFSSDRPAGDAARPESLLAFFVVLNELLSLHMDHTLRSFRFVREVLTTPARPVPPAALS